MDNSEDDMTKIEGISLAAEVSSVENQIIANNVASHRAKIADAISTLILRIANDRKNIEAWEATHARDQAEFKKLNDRRREALDIDEKRLAAIKAGNWDALDVSWGQPKDTGADTKFVMQAGEIRLVDQSAGWPDMRLRP